MRNEHNSRVKEPGRGDKGQVLVLFSFMIVVLLLLVMAVVDVGFFLHERALAQQTADAAALAGAQELPGDSATAEAVALDYVKANGMDRNDVEITFRCTTEVTTICTEGSGTYDTIVVTPKGQAPSFFGGLLRLIGADNLCWVDGCHVDATAAACRGSCGPIGAAPVDVMMVLDHSLSMSSTDLSNAQGAVENLFEDFNYQYQTVGLAVTPPVKTSNHCDAIEYWSQSYDWLSAGLTDTFQTSPHVLNNSSPPVYYSQCVERGGPSGQHTNLGSPLEATWQELQANGREDVTHGIILLTDGAANIAPTTTETTTTTVTDDTGWNYCTQQNDVNSGSGDNNGFEYNGYRACSSDNSRAADSNSGSGTSTSCTSSQKDRHTFWDFNLYNEIPSSAAISGVEVRLEAYATTSASTRKMCVEASFDGGYNWAYLDEVNISYSEQLYTLGNSTNFASSGLSRNNFTDSNFRLRVTNVSNNTSQDFYMDSVSAKVFYTYEDTSSTTVFDNNLGPCDWAATQADNAKALGIEIFAIGWGVSYYDRCDNDLPSSPYYNWNASDFLQSLATDEDHFFNEPKSADLDPIFSAIGSQLSSGSRLVE